MFLWLARLTETYIQSRAIMQSNDDTLKYCQEMPWDARSYIDYPFRSEHRHEHPTF